MANLTTLQTVSMEANRHYWDAHALLMSLKLMVQKLDDDEWMPEIRALLDMASIKLTEMQDCFNPHIPMNGRG
jgi:hypothetical protein